MRTISQILLDIQTTKEQILNLNVELSERKDILQNLEYELHVAEHEDVQHSGVNLYDEE